MTQAAPQPTLMIGPVPIYGDLILAPMAGYSDVPFRLLCREMGSAMSYTSCIPDDAVIARHRQPFRLSDFVEAERPVAVQLLAREEQPLVAAACQLLRQRPDIIDINMGCPAKHVAGGGRGAALLRDVPLIGRLAGALVRAVDVPVTAKIRLGWNDETRNYLDVARVLEDVGISAIAVHGRTKVQGYTGRADWSAIGEVRAAVRIPVLANGDVRTLGDIEAIKRITGCTAVMVGRGAVGNPWLFARVALEDVDLAERLRVIARHLAHNVDYFGDELGVVLFRKHVVRYIQGLDGAAALRPRLMAATAQAEVMELLERWTPAPR